MFAADAVRCVRRSSGGGTDPHWGDVVLLLNMDGAQGGTTFTDSSNSGISVTADGGVITSTADPIVGTSSAYYPSSSNNKLILGASSDLVINGDFTIEFFVDGDITNDVAFCSPANTYLYANQFRINGSVIFFASPSLQTTGKRHIAICRQGTQVQLYEGGVLKGSGTSSETFDMSGTYIGAYSNGNLQFQNGQMDEWRITNGYARYTAPFTPTTEPFPEG